MSWRLPECWIEVNTGHQYRGIAKASNLFELSRERAIFLGHSKTGRSPGWEPVKEIRGLPDDVSDEVQLAFENFSANVDTTYLTLEELKNIDLEKPIGFPEPESDGMVDQRGVEIYLMHEDEEYEYSRKIHRAIQEDVKLSLKKQAPVEMELGRKEVNGKIRLKPWVQIEGDKPKYYDKESEYYKTEWEKVSGSLKAEQKKRKHFAYDLPNLIEFMETFTGERFDWLSVTKPVEEQDVRIVFYSESW